MLIAIVILLAGVFVLFTGLQREASSPQSVPVAEIQYAEINIEVDTVGDLDAARSHTISSSIKGDRGKIIYLVEDGIRVEKGQELVRLDPAPYEKELRIADSKVNSLKAALDSVKQVVALEKNQVEKSIKTTEFNLKVAKLELSKLIDGTGPIQLAQYQEEVEGNQEKVAKYESYIKQMKILEEKGEYRDTSEIYLANKKLEELLKKQKTAQNKLTSYHLHVLPTSIEAERAKVEKARMELSQAKKAGIFKIGKAMAEVQKVQGQMDAASANFQLAQKSLEQTVIRAPFGGIAIHNMIFRGGQKRKARVGDLVLQNQPILFLPDISKMIVAARIREVDLYKVKIGQECSVRADAYPHTSFKGVVTSIGALATARFEGRGGAKYFRITVTLSENDNRLRPGMTARAVISTTKNKKVLATPLNTVFQEDGRSVCYKKVGHYFAVVDVSLGVENENVVEVLAGLSQGDQVSLIQVDRASPFRQN